MWFNLVAGNTVCVSKFFTNVLLMYVFLDEQQWPDILPQSKKSELISHSQAEQAKERELERKAELRRREAEEEKSVHRVFVKKLGEETIGLYRAFVILLRRRLEEIRRKEELEKQEREERERQRREEERRRREEQQRREREEQQRLELERQEREKERLEREQLEKERQQREKKELEKHLAQQRLEEERQRRLKGEKTMLSTDVRC